MPSNAPPNLQRVFGKLFGRRKTLVASIPETPSIQGQFPVPYEIFLEIIEALIAEAEQLQTRAAWLLDHEPTAPSQLRVSPQRRQVDIKRILRKRFRSVRVTLQVNRQTRAITHRTFLPVGASKYATKKLLPFGALILPEIDCFQPFTNGYEEGRDCCLISGPVSRGILDRIEHLYFRDAFTFHRVSAAGRSALLDLPNVKDVSIDLNIRSTDEREREEILADGAELIHVCVGFLLDSGHPHPVLGWYRAWLPFAEKGIRLYASVDNSGTPAVKVVCRKLALGMKVMREEAPGAGGKKRRMSV